MVEQEGVWWRGKDFAQKACILFFSRLKIRLRVAQSTFKCKRSNASVSMRRKLILRRGNRVNELQRCNLKVKKGVDTDQNDENKHSPLLLLLGRLVDLGELGLERLEVLAEGPPCRGACVCVVCARVACGAPARAHEETEKDELCEGGCADGCEWSVRDCGSL